VRSRGPLASFDWESSRGGELVLAGVDEAGRGCWAGPVVAAAVILPADADIDGLDDSKRLLPARREALFAAIRSSAVAWAACCASPREIEKVNILGATLLAMRRSVLKLRRRPDLVLVDGRDVPALLPCRTVALVKGDATSASVAAASIVAKVARDRVMRAWDRHFPGYGFADHKGYGAVAHKRALNELGPCLLHRSTYRPVALLRQLRIWHD